jgi:hypothetical protein
MTTIPVMFSEHSLTFYDGDFVPYSVDESHPNYRTILEALRDGTANVQALIELSRPVTAVKNAIAKAEADHADESDPDYLPAGKVSVTLNEIRYDGQPVHGVLVDRILWMLSEGFDIMPMVRFMENLYRNPADFARDELYLWLEKSDLPITEDGHFLAFKMVRSNFTSHHDGRTDNTPGKIVSMPRQEVDPIRDHTCSRGLHFCSKGYLGQYGSGAGNTVVLLKINPADVVSIPSDYDNAKGRAWKYEVLKQIGSNEDAAASYGGSPVVDSSGEEFDDEPAEYDDSDDLVDIPSDLTSALFAALDEIGVDTDDHDERIDWANEQLADLGFSSWNLIGSFYDLTKDQARQLLDRAREIKAIQDDEAEAAAEDAVEEARTAAEQARQAQIDAINSYGIIKLRKLTGKWKGYRRQELVDMLLAQVA